MSKVELNFINNEPVLKDSDTISRKLNRGYTPGSVELSKARPIQIGQNTIINNATIPNNSATTFFFYLPADPANKVFSVPSFDIYLGFISDARYLYPGGSQVPQNTWIMHGPFLSTYNHNTGEVISPNALSARVTLYNFTGSSESCTIFMNYKYIINDGGLL